MRCRTIEKTAVVYLAEEELNRGDETVRVWAHTMDVFGHVSTRRSQRVSLADVTRVITTTVAILRNHGYDVRVRALVTKD